VPTNEQVVNSHLSQMRSSNEFQRLSMEVKRKQEAQFLDQIKQMEEEDRDRYSRGRQAANTDMMMDNDRIIH
jgi:hypothetical protein